MRSDSYDPKELHKLVAEGLDNHQIAEQLGGSETSIRRALRKHNIVRVIVKKEVVKKERAADPDKVLQQENVALKRQVKALTEGETTAESVTRRIEAAVARQSQDLAEIRWDAPSGARTGGKSAQEAVLLFSDTHASEVVSLEETRGINEYNWEVMTRRMRRIVSGVISHTQHLSFPISKLNIWMLGDMLSGDIHEELAITNDRPTVEAVVDLAYDTVPMLLVLREFFPEIHVTGVVGNHPRRSKKPSMKEAHNNGDWLYYKMLEALLGKTPGFTFDIPRGSMAVTTICDRYRALLVHGDGIRTSMPGVPWGGVVRRVATLEQQFNKARTPLDFIAMGHWHSEQALGGIQAKTWINGSVKGPDEYGLKSFGYGHDAEQTLLTFHPRNGWTAQYAINLQEGKQPASEGWSA